MSEERRRSDGEGLDSAADDGKINRVRRQDEMRGTPEGASFVNPWSKSREADVLIGGTCGAASTFCLARSIFVEYGAEWPTAFRVMEDRHFAQGCIGGLARRVLEL